MSLPLDGCLNTLNRVKVRHRCLSGQWLTMLALVVFFMALPLQWYGYRTPLGLTVKPVHLSFFLLGLAALQIRAVGRSFFFLWKTSGIFILFYWAYLLAYFTCLMWTDNLMEGSVIIGKMGIYFCLFILLFFIFKNVDDSSLKNTINASISLGLLVFLSIVFYIFHSLGRNVLYEIINYIVNSNVDKLLHGIYPVVFNFSSGSVVSHGSEEFIGTSLRNSLIGSFVLFYIMNFFCVDRKLLTVMKKYIIALFLTFLIVVSVSRSNILVFFIVLGMSFFICNILGEKKKIISFYLKWCFFVCLLLVALAFNIDTVLGGIHVVAERLEAIGSDPRLNMFHDAAARINERPLLGHGVGLEVAALAGKHHRIHNLFLASWAEAGILGLVFSISYYLAAVMLWFRYVWSILRCPDRWTLDVSFGWVAVLPVLPLFRALVSGSGGSFTLIEWTCLALYFGLVAKNEDRNEQFSAKCCQSLCSV